MKHLLTPSLLLLSAAPLLAQGADDCSMAQPITGFGPHAWDTNAATTDGLPDPICLSFGTDQIEQDVWFSWTAPQDGPFRLSCCNGIGDSRVAVYGNSCAGIPIACNDDSCGFLSEVSFDASTGDTLLFRIGNFPGGAFSSGDFTISPTRVFNPNNGSTYELVTEFLSWSAADAEAQAALNNGVPGHLAVISDQAELDWILANLAPSRPWIGLYQDLSDPNYSEPSGGWKWVTGEPFTFQNWNPGEPNENPPPGGGPENFGEMFGNGDFNDAQDFHPQIQQYLIEWDGGGGTISQPFCTAVPNSTGATGEMTVQGSLLASNNDITLAASSLPAFQFGIFVVSENAVPPIPVPNGGNLCLGGVIGRYQEPSQILSSGASGEFSLVIDLTAIPQGLTTSATFAGDTWAFQAWHRDAGATTSNFTNGATVTFL